MIKCTIGNNVSREAYILDVNTTLKAALDEAGMDYTRGTMHLDGAPLGAGDLNKTFAELGYSSEEGHNKCFLLNVVKADNA